MSLSEGRTRTFKATEALEANRRVKLSTTANQVEYADAEDDHIGVTEEDAAINKHVSVILRTAQGTLNCEAAEAIDILDDVYGADDGKISDDPAGVYVGKAMKAASGSGSIIEILSGGITAAGQGDNPVLVGGAGGCSALDLVYVSDQTDAKMTVLPAQGTTAGRFADYIVPQALAAGAEGHGLKVFLLEGINTSAGSVGDPVYLSDGTAGGYTLTKPTGTDKVQVVGRIVEDHATTGAILFDLSGPQQVVHTHEDNSEGGGLTSPHITTGLEDANGAESLDIAATGSAVNHMGLTNAATGAAPDLAAKGDDTNVSMSLTAKGTGMILPGSRAANFASQTAETNTVTLTIAELQTGIIDGTPTAAATYTLPTAADLVAGIANCKVGTQIRFLVNNKAAGADTITVAGGAGSTDDGTLTVAQNVIREFVITVTNITGSSEAYLLYGLGA